MGNISIMTTGATYELGMGMAFLAIYPILQTYLIWGIISFFCSITLVAVSQGANGFYMVNKRRVSDR